MEFFTGCFSKYKIHYIWLLVICILDLSSVICSFVFYGISDKPPSALASAILMVFAFVSHCIIACYFHFSSNKPECEFDAKCVVYYGGTTLLAITSVLFQLIAGVLINNTSTETAAAAENDSFAGAISIMDLFGALLSAFFICFAIGPVICC